MVGEWWLFSPKPWYFYKAEFVFGGRPTPTNKFSGDSRSHRWMALGRAMYKTVVNCDQQCDLQLSLKWDKRVKSGLNEIHTVVTDTGKAHDAKLEVTAGFKITEQLPGWIIEWSSESRCCQYDGSIRRIHIWRSIHIAKQLPKHCKLDTYAYMCNNATRFQFLAGRILSNFRLRSNYKKNQRDQTLTICFADP